MHKKIVIAIDGYSSCGKSTVAKALAKELHYAYLDTGAMYRAVTFFCLKNKIDIQNPETVEDALNNIKINFKYNVQLGFAETFLNGENVEKDIRQLQVSQNVSAVSSIKSVRTAMVEQQRIIGKEKGIVLDGRDIGTVVFPNAELKIFMTADNDIRAKRRFDELVSKGIKAGLDEVKKNLEQRDLMDSTREESPLRKADDALMLDNSHLFEKQQLEIALQWARERINS